MLRIFSFALLSMLALTAGATGFNSVTHELYTDGSRYYLQAKPHVLIISSSVDFPLALDPLYDNVVLTPDGAGGWILQYSSGAVSGNWSKATNSLYFSDYDGDGFQDIFIRAKNGAQQSLIVLGKGGTSPVVVAVDGSAGGIDHSSSSGYSISFSGRTIIATKPGHLTMVGTIGASGISGFAAKNFDYDFANDQAISTDEPESGDYVGSTGYRTSVGPDGSLNAVFAVELPEGIAGLTPDVAVTYNSNGGNGLLGKGFTLSAVSSIRRCSKTVATEGASRSISFTDDDSLCLGGLKLIQIDNREPMENGAEYRTEINNYSRITLTNVDGKKTFTVERKDGLVDTYAYTVKARGHNAGKEKEWLISERRDRFDNVISYHYRQESYGDVYLGDITYSNITVAFNYNEGVRNDSVIRFSGGDEYLGSKYLEAITVSNTAVFREYNYLYNLDGNGRYDEFSGQLQLDGIQECGYRTPGDTNTKACKPVVSLGWTENGFELVDDASSQVSTLDSRRQTLAVDWDESGTDDIIVLGTDKIGIHYSSNGALGTLETLYSFPAGRMVSSITPVDLDLDGQLELLLRTFDKDTSTADEAYDLQWHIMKHNGTIVNVGNEVSSGNSQKYPVVADLNGDAYPDVIFPSGTGQWKISYNNSHASNAPSLATPDDGISGTSESTDGLTYLGRTADKSLFLNEKNSGLDLLTIKSDGTVNTYVTGIVSEKYLPLDANGDGLKDLLVGSSGNLILYLNSGLGFNKIVTSMASDGILDLLPDVLTYRNLPPSVLDFNGDGLDDVAYTSGDHINVIFSTGNDFRIDHGAEGWQYVGVSREALQEIIRSALDLPEICFKEISFLNSREVIGSSYNYQSPNISGWYNSSVSGDDIADSTDNLVSNIGLFEATNILNEIQSLYDATINNPSSSLHLPYQAFFSTDEAGNVIFDSEGFPVLKDGVSRLSIQASLGAEYFNDIGNSDYQNFLKNSFVFYWALRKIRDGISECKHLVEENGGGFSSQQVQDLVYLNESLTYIRSGLIGMDSLNIRTADVDLGYEIETEEQQAIYDFTRALYISGGLDVTFKNHVLTKRAFEAIVYGIGETELYEYGGTPITSSLYNYNFADIDGDSSLDLVRQFIPGISSWGTSLNRISSKLKVESIEDLKGASTNFVYGVLSDPYLYSSSDGDEPGSLLLNGKYELISSVTSVDSSGNTNINRHETYNYRNLRVDLFGRGLLGVEEKTVTDNVLNTKTTTTYYQDFPLIGRESSVATKVGDLTVAESSTTWSVSDNAPFSVTPDIITEAKKELSPNTAYVESETDFTFDDYGNMTGKVVTLKDKLNSDAQLSSYTYVADYPFEAGYNAEFDWTIGFAKTISETWSRANNGLNPEDRSFADKSLSKTYTQYSNTLKPETEVVHTPSGDLTTTYGYTSYGVVETLTSESPSDLTYTITYSDFEADKWPKTVKNNVFGETASESRTYDTRYGGITGSTDFAGITTSSSFDEFGRLESATDALSNETEFSYTWCSGTTVDCGLGAISTKVASYSVTTSKPGAPEVIEYFDSFGNKVKESTEGFTAASYIYRSWEYDDAGRLEFESIPSYSFPISTGTSTAYDAMGRVDLVTTAGGGEIDYSYELTGSERKVVQAVTAVSTDSSVTDRTYTREDYLAADGLIVKSIQAKDTVDEVTTLYDYDAMGNLDWSQVQDATGEGEHVTVTQKFDSVGNRIVMNDPDTGKITDSYSPRGNLKSTENNAQQTVTYTYDGLDRRTTRTEAEGTTTWYYDNADQCTLDDADEELLSLTGMLCAVNAPHDFYKVQYAYTSAGLPVATRQEINGYSFQPQEHWLVLNSFDTYGRDAGTKFDSEVEVVRDYTDSGYLDLVYNYKDPTTQYYDITAIDAWGNVTEYGLGNGVDVTQAYHGATGQIASITADNSNGIELVSEDYEWFTDGALASKDHARPGMSNEESYGYDYLNRLTSVTKDGALESYTYDHLGNILTKPGVTGTYAYEGIRNAGPHAVTSAGGVDYGYDARGNMTQRGTYSVSYTSYDKPQWMSAVTGTEQFRYAPDRSRFLHSSGNKYTVYQAGVPYEEIFTTGQADSVKRHYIDGGLVLDLEGATETFKYQVKDYKDSLLLVTDSSGNALQYATFDAYGSRTEGDNSLVTRGFTDHEHLDNGLIHMNGRVYDPILGRFLSPDILVQAPYNSQSYNRYSYVWNNPVSFVDPTGYTKEGGYYNEGYFSQWSFESESWVLEELLEVPVFAYNFVASTLNGPLNTIGWVGSIANEYEGELITIGTSFHPLTGGGMTAGARSLGALRFLNPRLADDLLVREARVIGKDSNWTYPDDLPEINSFVTRSEVWKLKPTERGSEIEAMLANTDYKDWYNIGSSHNGYFPLVDFQKGSTLVSLKSVDTTGSTWMGRMQSHIDDLATREATVSGQKANMVLDIRVQPGGAGDAYGLIQYGRQQGVGVIVKEF